MAKLNPAQHDSIAEQFAELVVDGMDMKHLFNMFMMILQIIMRSVMNMN